MNVIIIVWIVYTEECSMYNEQMMYVSAENAKNFFN